VDLDEVIRRGDTTLNVVLEAGDVVYVPPTGLGTLGLALEQIFGGGPNYQASAPRTDRHRPLNSSAIQSSHTSGSGQDLDALQETLSQLRHQLAELSEAQQALTQATRELQLPPALAEDSRTPSPTRRPPREVVFTSAEAARGGAGESPRPTEGVRFWGP
jgi:hypothetical protein